MASLDNNMHSPPQPHAPTTQTTGLSHPLFPLFFFCLCCVVGANIPPRPLATMATTTASRTAADDACVQLEDAANAMTNMINVFERSSSDEWQSAYHDTFCNIVCPSLANTISVLHTHSFQPPLLDESVAKLQHAMQQLADAVAFMWPVTMKVVEEKWKVPIARALANPLAAACHALHHTRIASAQPCVTDLAVLVFGIVARRRGADTKLLEHGILQHLTQALQAESTSLCVVQHTLRALFALFHRAKTHIAAIAAAALRAGLVDAMEAVLQRTTTIDLRGMTFLCDVLRMFVQCCGADVYRIPIRTVAAVLHAVTTHLKQHAKDAETSDVSPPFLPTAQSAALCLCSAWAERLACHRIASLDNDVTDGVCAASAANLLDAMPLTHSIWASVALWALRMSTSHPRVMHQDLCWGARALVQLCLVLWHHGAEPTKETLCDHIMSITSYTTASLRVGLEILDEAQVQTALTMLQGIGAMQRAQLLLASTMTRMVDSSFKSAAEAILVMLMHVMVRYDLIPLAVNAIAELVRAATHPATIVQRLADNRLWQVWSSILQAKWCDAPIAIAVCNATAALGCLVPVAMRVTAVAAMASGLVHTLASANAPPRYSTTTASAQSMQVAALVAIETLLQHTQHRHHALSLAAATAALPVPPPVPAFASASPSGSMARALLAADIVPQLTAAVDRAPCHVSIVQHVVHVLETLCKEDTAMCTTAMHGTQSMARLCKVVHDHHSQHYDIASGLCSILAVFLARCPVVHADAWAAIRVAHRAIKHHVRDEYIAGFACIVLRLALQGLSEGGDAVPPPSSGDTKAGLRTSVTTTVRALRTVSTKHGKHVHVQYLACRALLAVVLLPVARHCRPTTAVVRCAVDAITHHHTDRALCRTACMLLGRAVPRMVPHHWAPMAVNHVRAATVVLQHYPRDAEIRPVALAALAAALPFHTHEHTKWLLSTGLQEGGAVTVLLHTLSCDGGLLHQAHVPDAPSKVVDDVADVLYTLHQCMSADPSLWAASTEPQDLETLAGAMQVVLSHRRGRAYAISTLVLATSRHGDIEHTTRMQWVEALAPCVPGLLSVLQDDTSEPSARNTHDGSDCTSAAAARAANKVLHALAPSMASCPATAPHVDATRAALAAFEARTRPRTRSSRRAAAAAAVQATSSPVSVTAGVAVAVR